MVVLIRRIVACQLLKLPATHSFIPGTDPYHLDGTGNAPHDDNEHKTGRLFGEDDAMKRLPLLLSVIALGLVAGSLPAQVRWYRPPVVTPYGYGYGFGGFPS